ncbi:hypothetical protein THIOM_001750, partial [Candidatus Thiomargarita nelsonii]
MKYLLILTLPVLIVVILGINSSETEHQQNDNNFSRDTDNVICAEDKNIEKNNVQYYIDKYGRASQDDAQVRRIY